MTNEASRWIAASIAAVALAGCERAEPPPPAPVAKAPAPAAAPPPMVTPSALGRAEILAALAEAAAGTEARQGLAGRTFVLRLPFACQGAGATAAGETPGLASAAWSKDGKSLRLSVAPADWATSPLVLSPGAEPAWDGVEGFWIARPWLMSEACPTTPAPVGGLASAPSPMSAGLAVILEAEGSRLGRRQNDDAYSFVVRGTDGKPPEPAAGGYRLVLEGRIGSFPDGGAVRCTSESPDRRPVCVAAVQLDVIAFEDAAGLRLSEWRPT